MKHKTFVILIMMAFPVMLNAQTWEIGFFGGGSNYYGDLSGHSVLLEETHPAIGALVRYKAGNIVNLRFGLTYGTISGSDQNLGTPLSYTRNLSFQSDIFELAVIPELTIFNFRETRNWTPYIFAGVAGFHHNPKAMYGGEWIELQPLGTEGQGMEGYPEKYSLFQVAFPAGIGFKIGFGDGLNLGLDLGIRYTITDYLDDVSTYYVTDQTLGVGNGRLAADMANRSINPQTGTPFEYTELDRRGNPDIMDMYMFGGITITYTMGAARVRGGCPIY